MPTLYTSLRAQHRHKIETKTPTLPPSDREPAADQAHLDEHESVLAFEKRMTLESTEATGLTRKPGKQKHVVVVGGGFAGLCAAYELIGLDYEVTVYEAQDDVGGRVQSIDDFIPGKMTEGGGELIGTNHPLWNLYARKFKLHLVPTKDYGHSQVRFNNSTLSFQQTEDLTNELEEQLRALSLLAEGILDPFEPWTNPNSHHLDSISIGRWIDHSGASKVCKQALRQMMEADNGIVADEQSMLAVLAMIKGGGLDRYWTDTELWRCEDGNQKLAQRFREKLNTKKQRVFPKVEVKKITRTGGTITLDVSNNSGCTLPTLPIDDVILAVPPSVFSRITFSDEKLSAKLGKAPSLGSNVKFLIRLDQRFWQDFGSSPNATEDQPVNLTWETTEHNDDEQGDFAFVAFSGANSSDTCVAWDAKDRDNNYIAAMAPLYPLMARHKKDSRFMNWPQNDWTKGSYYFPRKGEVTEWGPFWKVGFEGWLHFAGEHTCYAFMGYMEGALASGFRLARRLAIRDDFIPA